MTSTATQQYNESELLIYLKSGNQKAFEELYDRFAPAFLGVLIRIVHDEKQAEDLLQDSFVKIWYNIQSYNPVKGRLFTWMHTIVRNSALDYLRTSRHTDECIDDISPGSIGVVMPSYHTIGLAYWVNLTLCAEQRQVIDLVYFQGYTHQEIADEFGFPIGTVKTRVRRALQHLRDRI